MTRVTWFRLILGLVLGLIFGLYYAWFISPRQIHQSSPLDLSPRYQDEYRTLVASAYSSTGNFMQAVSRLELLKDAQSALSLDDLAQRHLASGRADKEVRALAQLASAIEAGSGSDKPSPTSTPAPSTPCRSATNPKATGPSKSKTWTDLPRQI